MSTPSRWHARPRNWAITAAAVATLICGVAWPRLTGYAVGTVVAVSALWFGIRRLLTERRPKGDDLTADEARTLADDLSLQLYRAEDALSFVGECCDIADRHGGSITTAQVREWLKGAQCARQAGLVINPGPSSEGSSR